MTDTISGDIGTLLSEAENSFTTLKSLNEIANNPLLDDNSKRAIIRQMHNAIIKHYDILDKIASDPLLEVKPLEPVNRKQTVESEEDEEIPKKSNPKSRNPASKYGKT